MNEPLLGKTIFITGAAKRLGKSMALACAKAGADLILHYGNSSKEIHETETLIKELGRDVRCFQADLSDSKAVHKLWVDAFAVSSIFGLINNAAIFKKVDFQHTTLEDWILHMQVNLTTPFLLSQAFASQIPTKNQGRIINILDWRALRPGKDHFPYTISKAALAAMTKSTSLSLAPNIVVNAIALGAILPPENQLKDDKIIENVPMKRWANLEELDELIVFLLTGPTYITGEIIHLDGGRHLV